MSNHKGNQKQQAQSGDNERFQGAKSDFELWNRFEQINSTLSGQINHLEEYRSIFSNYQQQIFQTTKQTMKTMSDRICKLVEETIQQEVYNKIESQWRTKQQNSFEKCFKEILSSLQKTFGQIDDITKQSNPYTSLNIISIRCLFDSQLSQANRSLRGVNEDELFTLQSQIDDHFKKYVQFSKHPESNSPAQPSSANQLPKSDQGLSQNNQLQTDDINQNKSTQAQSTNNTNPDFDDDVSYTKKNPSKEKQDRNADPANQSGLFGKIKSIFKKDENRASQVNLEGVSNDFRYCHIKKQWIFEGSEENNILDEPPPIIPAGGQTNQNDSIQTIPADSSMSNIGSESQQPYDPKSALTRPVNYRNARDIKNKAKEQAKSKPRPAAVNFMQVLKADDSMSNFNSTKNNIDDSQQNNNIESNNLLPSTMNLNQLSNFGQESEKVNIQDIIDRLNSQIQDILEKYTNEAFSQDSNIYFEEIEIRLKEKSQESGQNVCKELQSEVMKIQTQNNQRLRRMQVNYENQIKSLTKDYMELMDETFQREKQNSQYDDDTLNKTIDSSVMDFCNKQSEKIKQLQAELLKKQCQMSKQDNKNMEIIKNMVQKITQLESKLLRFTDMETENENLQQINAQLQQLSKQSQQQAIKVFGIKHQNMQSINTINSQLAEQIHSRQQLIDTLQKEITQKNRAIHEFQAKNTNLQNISYEKEERINELQSILDEKEEELNKLLKKESLLNEDIERLKETLVTVQHQLLSKKQELSQHINDITCLQEKNENFEQIELNMNEELVNLQLEFNQYREEADQKIDELKAELQQVNQQKSHIEENLEQITNEKDILIQEVQSLQQNIESNKEEYEQEITVFEVLIKELIEGQQQHQYSSEIKQPKLTQILELLNYKMQEVQHQKEQMEQQIQDLNQDLENERACIEQLQLETDQIAQQKDKIVQQKDQISANQESLIKEKQTLEQQKQTLEKEKQTLQQDKLTLEQQKQTLEQEKQTLELEKQALEQEKQALEQEKQTLEKENEERINFISQLSEEIQSKEIEYNLKQTEMQQYDSIIKEKEIFISQLEQKLEELNETQSNINEIINEKNDVITQKEETIKELKESLENSKVKYEEKLKELQDMHGMIANLQNELKQKDIQIEETSQLNEQLSIQFQELNMQHDGIIYQNEASFQQIEQLSQRLNEQNQLLEELNQEKDALSNTLFSNQELIESYKLKLEELQKAFEFKNITIVEQEKQIDDLNETATQLDLLCQQQSLEIQNYKQIEEKLSSNQIDKEEFDKKEKELKEKIEQLNKDIQELINQNDEQTNEFANKILILESSNTDLNDQMEQIISDKDRQIQLVKEKFLQLENEYRGQIEDLQSQLKWEKQMNEDSDIRSIKKFDDNNEFNDGAEGHHQNQSLISANMDLSSKQDLDSYKEKIDHLEVQIIKLKNELQTSNNTNSIIERQIKALHQQNENLAKEISSLQTKLENEIKKSINIQKETDEQIESITNEKRHLKMNFDELLEKMNDSQSFEKLSQMQREIDSLKLENEQLISKHKNQSPQINQSPEKNQSPQQNTLPQQPFIYKKSLSEEIQEINLREQNSDHLQSPIIPSLPILDKNQQLNNNSKQVKKGGGLFNTLAGIFLTDKDRQMLQSSKK